MKSRLMCERGHVAKSADQKRCDVMMGSPEARRAGKGTLCNLTIAPEPKVDRCPRCRKGLLVVDEGVHHCSFCPTSSTAPGASEKGATVPGTGTADLPPSDLRKQPAKWATTVRVRRRPKNGPSRAGIESAKWLVRRGRAKARP